MRDALVELNGRIVRHEGGIDATFDRAWRMLRMRHILAAVGDGYVVLPRGRELVSYYANSVAHLLGPFERAARVRDSLPIDRVVPISSLATCSTFWNCLCTGLSGYLFVLGASMAVRDGADAHP